MRNRLRALMVALLALALLPIAATPAAAVTARCDATYRCAFISGQYQTQWNYCGPAAAATILTNYRISGVSQAWLANRMGTDNLRFTSPLAMDDAINDRVNAAVGVDLNPYTTYRSVTNAQLRDAVRYKIYYWESPFIITVYSNKIWYPDAPSWWAHYLVIYGYSEEKDGYMVWDPDPNGGGVHHLGRSAWERVAYPGRFVVVPNL